MAAEQFDDNEIPPPPPPPSVSSRMSSHQLPKGSTMSEPERLQGLRVKRQLRNVCTFEAYENLSFTQTRDPKDSGVTGLISGALRSNLLLNSLKDDEVKILVEVADPVEVEDGDEIIKQGDEGDFFFVIESGQFEVMVNGATVATLMDGQSFGELAILCSAPRVASVVAASPGKLWRIGREEFRWTLGQATFRQTDEVIGCLREVDLFDNLDDRQLHTLAKAVSTITFEKDRTVVTKGEEGEIFYLVLSGSVSCNAGGGTAPIVLGENSYFGERCLVTTEPRAATVVALEETVLFALAREDFQAVLGDQNNLSALETVHQKRVLLSSELFSRLPPEDRDMVSESLVERQFEAGTAIAALGDVCTSFYVVISGSVSLTLEEGPGQEVGPGSTFNFEALFAEESSTTCHATATTDAVCMELPRGSREHLFQSSESLKHLIDLHESRQKDIFTKRADAAKLALGELEPVAVLGAGTFGRVKLVKSPAGDLFALKALQKQQLVEQKQTTNVIREKDLQSQCVHPFILALHSSFKDGFHIYMLLEYCPGGELFTVFHQTTRGAAQDGVSELESKFYCGGVMLALLYLQSKKIVYRDLKPENVLIDFSGYIKIIDFGFAKILKGTTSTMCGTPEYMCPELILGRGYDFGVDWWAFGVLLYESVVGRSPFAPPGNPDNIDQIYRNIIKSRFRFPKDWRFTELKDLICGLLDPNHEARIGGEDHAVRLHPWWNDLDLKMLEAKALPAPWKPELADPTDTSHFDPIQLDEGYNTRWRDPDPSAWDAF